MPTLLQSSWLDNSNFRITTELVFELLNVTNQQFYYWGCYTDDNGVVRFYIPNTPDTTSERLDFPIDKMPQGGVANYRINAGGYLQLKNDTTGLWHTPMIVGTANSPRLEPNPIGEE